MTFPYCLTENIVIKSAFELFKHKFAFGLFKSVWQGIDANSVVPAGECKRGHSPFYFLFLPFFGIYVWLYSFYVRLFLKHFIIVCIYLFFSSGSKLLLSCQDVSNMWLSAIVVTYNT